MKKYFAEQYSDELEKRERIRKRREKSVSVKSILDKQPLTALEKLILMWPPHDIRFDGYGTFEEELMVDMIKGAEHRVIRKDIHQGILEVTVELVRNLDEIERYNAAAKKHNQEWIAMGSPSEIFDPVHGDSFAVKDQYIDPVMTKSKHYNLPDSAYSDISTGILAKKRPNIQRKSHIRVKYQMSISSDDQFILGYAAYDYEDRIIYYNSVKHHDLAYLVRRSVQEIWGNPLLKNDRGPLLEGVRMLINGKKINICKKDNQFPEFLATEDTRIKSTEKIQKLEVAQERQIQVSNVASYYMPIIFIIGFVFCLIWTFVIMAGGDLPLVFKDQLDPYGDYGMIRFLALGIEVLIKPPMLGCILFLIGTMFCRKIALSTERNASEINAQRKFL